MLQRYTHDSVHEIRLARPPVNALNTELIATLEQAVKSAPQAGAKALVISGAEGMFSAGLDVPALLALSREALTQTWVEFFGLLQGIAESPIPVVAAITGHSPAGGAVISLYADYRVMAAGKFRIGLNETQVGLPLPPCIYRALRYVVGPRQAERLGVPGLLITPEEALRVNLVDEVVSPEQVISRAVEYAQSLLRLPSHAMQETRARARQDLVDAFEGLQADIPRWVDIWYLEESQAALKALLAKLKR